MPLGKADDFEFRTRVSVREAIRNKIAATVNDPAEVTEELRHLARKSHDFVTVCHCPAYSYLP